jgi:hypothetical protein
MEGALKAVNAYTIWKNNQFSLFISKDILTNTVLSVSKSGIQHCSLTY